MKRALVALALLGPAEVAAGSPLEIGRPVPDALDARVTPESFLINGEGRLRYRGRVKSKQGAADLESAVEAVLAGRNVRTPVANAFGCAIQRD